MIEKEVVNKNFIEILKKHNMIAYKLYKNYLTSDKFDSTKDKQIKKIALELYLNSLEKDEQSSIKEINKAIKGTKQEIQNNLLSTFYETYAVDIVQTFYNDLLMKQANIIAFRDNKGFYGLNDEIQTELNNCSLELKILHNEINNKEELMNGKRNIRKNTLCRKETLFLSYFLGYGEARDELLNNQDRNKVLTKNKEKK